tara:strand:- start:206 stop:472 length:267 start_codon:yes stop_codon:yes gene_type:complete
MSRRALGNIHTKICEGLLGLFGSFAGLFGSFAGLFGSSHHRFPKILNPVQFYGGVSLFLDVFYNFDGNLLNNYRTNKYMVPFLFKIKK